ncbi:MAG: hypothetical protein ABSF63_02465 [Candidatus Bathyarchaeia archaeon]|jgi:hypothetical protein
MAISVKKVSEVGLLSTTVGVFLLVFVVSELVYLGFVNSPLWVEVTLKLSTFLILVGILAMLYPLLKEYLT